MQFPTDCAIAVSKMQTIWEHMLSMMGSAKSGAILLLIALVTPRYLKMNGIARHILLYGYAVMRPWDVSATRRI